MYKEKKKEKKKENAAASKMSALYQTLQSQFFSQNLTQHYWDPTYKVSLKVVGKKTKITPLFSARGI